MRQINCIFPIRVQISACPEELDLDSLAGSVTSVVRSRLRFAEEILASHCHLENWSSHLNQPTIAFAGENLSEDPRKRIEQVVQQAISRALNTETLNQERPQFILAQYRPGTRKSQGPPAFPRIKRKSPGKRAKPPVPTIRGQQQVFWDALRKTVLSLDRGQDLDNRASVIKLLIDLIDLDEARAILRAGLDIPFLHSGVRFDILNELYVAAKKNDMAWDLMLYGIGQENDTVAEGRFFDWFKQAGGQRTVNFLELKLSGADRDLQLKAAKVALYLLQKQFEQEAVKLASNFARLRKMAAKHNLWTGGALGAESLRELVASQTSLLVDLVEDLAVTVQSGPTEDPHADDDVVALRAFQKEINSRLGMVSGLDLTALEDLDIRLAQAVQAATQIRSRIRIIWQNARLLIQFLGSGSSESDEVSALFQVRHKYISVLIGVLSDAAFVDSLHQVDFSFVNFADTVARVKRLRVLDRYSEIDSYFLRAKQIQPPNFDARDETYLDMHKALERYKSSAWQDFFPAISLADEVKGETKVNIWGLRVGMFSLYALALRMENDLAKFEIGSASFRQDQRKQLDSIRGELAGYFQSAQFKSFSDRAEAIRKTLEDVADAIRHRAKIDVGIHLLITAVASLLTFGAAAIARVALLGETLAVVRTAEAASTIVLLVEAGTFTAAQLGGENLAFGKAVTIGGAAESFLSNVAFFGVFRALGNFTATLARGGVVLRFLAPHLINLSVLTGVSALVTRVQTGQWPQDIGLFLLSSFSGYVIIAGLSTGAQKLAAPAIQARVMSMAKILDQENAALLARYESAVNSRTLTEPEFEAMRKQQLAINGSARELARFLQHEGQISKENFQAIEDALQYMDDVANSARFVTPEPLLVGRTGGRLVRALPLPAEIPGLVRLGDTEVYRFDPTHSPSDLPSALTRYEASGYRIQRYPAGITRVISSRGDTVFVLEPGPAVPSLLALPPAPAPRVPGVPPQMVTFPEFVTGPLSSSARATLNSELQRINPKLVDTLQAEFDDSTALAALGLLVEQRGNLKTRWPIDAVRGLASMLQLERGITRATVRRLFLGRNSNELSALFEEYQQIKNLPGANLLVDAELEPSRAFTLIHAYDAIRRAHLRIPEGMTRKGIRGLLRWTKEATNIDEVVRRLASVPLDRRLARLESDSPIVDPALRPPSRNDEILRRHAQDVRPGINLFHGSLDEVVQAVENLGQKHGGRFSEPAIRSKFLQELRTYRDLASSFQSGRDVERNLEGQRNELELVIASLETGAEVFSLGRGTSETAIRINPALFPLPNGLNLINAPAEIAIQLDLGARRIGGRLLAVEATTGTLSLPDSVRALDPQSGIPSGTIDWAALNPSANANERKWMQMIKLRAAAHFATELARAWGNATVELPELVISVGAISEPARRAADRLGFTVHVTGK